MAWSRRILWMGVAVLTAAVVGGHQVSATASSFKCHVSDSLYDGLVPGKVRAAGFVDCSGYGGRGSVRFTVRLQQYDAQAKKWKNVKSKSRRYRTLRARHGLAVVTPCVVAKFRATFTAVLDNAAGARVSTNAQKLGPLQAHVPCMVTIGGTPTGGRVRHQPRSDHPSHEVRFSYSTKQYESLDAFPLPT